MVLPLVEYQSSCHKYTWCFISYKNYFVPVPSWSVHPPDVHWALGASKRVWVLIPQGPTWVTTFYLLAKIIAAVQECSLISDPAGAGAGSTWPQTWIQDRGCPGCCPAGACCVTAPLASSIPQPGGCCLPVSKDSLQLKWFKSLVMLMIQVINKEIWIK